MKKTLMCNINPNITERPQMVKITATKVDELETGKRNLYRDDDGNIYMVRYNKFLRRNVFVKM